MSSKIRLANELTMGFLRFIWKDINRLSQLGILGKIGILIIGIAIFFVIWYPGTEWWTTPVPRRYFTRNPARCEEPVVALAIIFGIYIGFAIDRYRKSR
jgi:hypothetical protein